MATPFENVYRLFMENIGKDIDFFKDLNDEEIQDTLEIYLLKSANLEFTCCQKDLTKVDLTTKCFLEDLDFEEMSILSYGMLVSYLEPKINREEHYRLELGDRDFKVTGRDKSLNALVDRKNDARKQLRDYIMKYQYTRFKVL